MLISWLEVDLKSLKDGMKLFKYFSLYSSDELLKLN